jgi:hypothetical protein
MLHDFTGMSGLITLFRALSFEMVFYLIVAGLFAGNLHRLGAWWSAGIALVLLPAVNATPPGGSWRRRPGRRCPGELIRWGAVVSLPVTASFAVSFALRERRMPAALTCNGGPGSFSVRSSRGDRRMPLKVPARARGVSERPGGASRLDA